jgi:TusA-related sulfurtransferase
MVKRSEILKLPAEVKKWLDRALAENNFSEYMLLSAELKERGFSISKSALHRYGQKLENKLLLIKQSTEAAQAIVDAAPDEGDARSEAILGLIQTELFESIMKLEESEDMEPGQRMKVLASCAKSIATMTRASVNQKRWKVEFEDKVRQEERERAAEQAAASAKAGGVSEETILAIRRDILGMKT